MRVFVVEMLRWGSRENHSYVQSVHSTALAAEKAGYDAVEERGGKYEMQVTSFSIDGLKHEVVCQSEGVDDVGLNNRGTDLEKAAKAAHEFLVSIEDPDPTTTINSRLNLAFALKKLGYT